MAGGAKQGQQGTSMGGVEVAPGRRRRAAAARRRQEQAWAAKAGPVEVRQVEQMGDGAAAPGSQGARGTGSA